jgi:N-acyl-D-amino-acid deacylase
MFDSVIKNGLVIDGSGSPGIIQDIAISKGIITAVGSVGETAARELIEAQNLVVCPGFIDIHAHSDFNLFVTPPARSKIMQGVTTEVCGNCGLSGAPLLGRAKEQRQKSLTGIGVALTWSTMREYIELLQRQPLFCNVALLVGHGNLRGSIIGYENRGPSRKELDRMSGMLREALDAGAWGLSSGLCYPPGTYAEIPELIELAKIAARYGGIYASHIRSEEDLVVEAVTEAITIGRDSGAAVQISHLKTMGEKNWGKLDRIFEIIEEAINAGLDITADRYPYTAAATDLDAMLPAWACEGGIDAELERLRDKDMRERIFTAIVNGRKPAEVFERVLISRVSSERNRELEGKTVTEAARLRKQEMQEMFFNLLIDEQMRIDAIFFTMSEENLQRIYLKDYVMIGSDSAAWDTEGLLGSGKPHPRCFGAYPRVFRKYVIKDAVLQLEQAVRKMTGQPALKLGLQDRGLIRPGYRADLVILDAAEIRDRATYADPQQFPEGICRVMVNGRWVVQNGRITGECPGKVLLKGRRGNFA